MAARGWGRGNEFCLKGTEFQLCQMKKVMEMNDGDGCTTLQKYLTH